MLRIVSRDDCVVFVLCSWRCFLSSCLRKVEAILVRQEAVSYRAGSFECHVEVIWSVRLLHVSLSFRSIRRRFCIDTLELCVFEYNYQVLVRICVIQQQKQETLTK